MTSNMGAEVILENFEDLEAVGNDHRGEIIETTRMEVFDMLKENLRPEFLNRIDEKIMFLPLNKAEIKLIAKILLKKVRKNLANQDISLEFSESAMDLLSDLGYDPQFGARPLKRVIQKEIINELSKQVLAGSYGPGDTLHIGTDKKGFTFGKKANDSKEKPTVEKANAKSKKEKDLSKLKKATEDVEDAVKDIKKDQNGKTDS